MDNLVDRFYSNVDENDIKECEVFEEFLGIAKDKCENIWSDDDLNWILPIREQYDVPLWMGESGENSNTWYTDAVSLFENNNVGWAWWAMKKIGSVNSPYRIVVNDGYQKILNYWKDEGDKPTEQEAYDAMMKLADNALSENCLYRKGISDALLRQPHTNATLPFKERQVIPGVVYLSDYDLGKNNYAYYDKDVATYHQSSGSFVAWNRGWRYRNDGVDIEDNNDNTNSNGYHLGFVDKGECTLKFRNSYNIDGMTCAACAARIERILSKNENVLDASVSFPLKSAIVDVADENNNLEEIIKSVNKIGYKAKEASDEVIDKKIPTQFAEDSNSFFEELTDQDSKESRPAIIHHSSSGRFAIREGKWKLVMEGRKKSEKRELYDLINDPKEQPNVIKDHPNINIHLTKKINNITYKPQRDGII